MAQLFRKRNNAFARAVLAGAVPSIFAALYVVHAVFWSPYTTRVGLPLEQPVPFSHQHHVGGLGIDCRYCHTSVEKSAFAGMPDTYTCMTCHSQIWTDAEILRPVRESLATDTPLQWNRVHDVPDFVYFDHSIHVEKGIGCTTCHGRVDKMPIAWKEETLYMKWCLECHQHPQEFLRPRDQVFNVAWVSPKNQTDLGKELAREYQIRDKQLTDCSICHR